MHLRNLIMVVVFSLWLCCLINPVLGQGYSNVAPVQQFVSQFAKGHLYRGKEYNPVDYYGVEGHQGFAGQGVGEDNTVRFEGVVYQGVPLMYDLVMDELITRHPDFLVNIILTKAFISMFTIGNDTFVHLRAEENGLAKGYYQQLFKSATTSCYVRRSKNILDFRSATDKKRRFVETVRFYVKSEGEPNFTLIKNQRTLLNMYKEKKKELGKLLYEKNLSFKASPAETILFVLHHVEGRKE